MARKIHKQSLSSLKKKAWKLLSLIIRQSAADKNGMARCYTCGAIAHWKYQQAGHGIGGRHNAVLLDESLIRVQCPRCNIFLRGNYPVFTNKLISEHGLEWHEKKLSDSRKIVKWTASDMRERIKEYESRLEKLNMRKVA